MATRRSTLTLLAALLSAQGAPAETQLPAAVYAVHDEQRPQPPRVAPASQTPNAPPPSDAVSLFPEHGFAGWRGDRGEVRGWRNEGSVITAGGPSRYIESEAEFGDVQLHLEWRTPRGDNGQGQKAGNSGLYLMGLYEIQILSSADTLTYPDGQAAAIYGQTPPLVNASLPSGEWQSFDVLFEAPRFAGDELVRPAYLTLFHNGVVVHHHREILGATRHKRRARYRAHPAALPLRLQYHGSAVQFRNLWVRSLASRPAVGIAEEP